MKLTGAQIVIEALKRENVEIVFGYPGGSVLNLYDVLFDSEIKHYLSVMNRALYMRQTDMPE